MVDIVTCSVNLVTRCQDFAEMSAPRRSQFEAKCSRDGEFTTLSECLPSDCGAAPEVMHTSNEKKSAVFPESVEYASGVG